MKKALTVLFLAILLAIVTRFYLLGKVPAGFDLDEAAQGYNAYSILKTGKDEFGMPFPTVFRSFADFKTPIYIYLIVPLIPLFGLTPFAVRFPSFLGSILTLPVLFLLIIEITHNKKTGLFLGALAAFLLAISPWHILFGRTNFECNVALLFFLSGVYFFYLGLKKPKIILLSGIFFAIALPAYHSQRLLVPLTTLFFFLRFHKTLFDKNHARFSYLAILIAFLISLPTLLIINTPGFLARVLALNLSRSLPGVINTARSWSWLVNSSLFLKPQEFFSLYLSYFSPRNLFFLGDSGPRSSFPELSTFYFWQLPFYFHGLYLLIKKKDYGELRNFTFLMLLIAPLPAALTRDPFSTIRSLPLVIPLTIIVSLSLHNLWSRLKTQPQKITTPIIFCILIIYSLLKLYSSVIILNEKQRGQYWGYGWQQVVEILNQKTDRKLPVIVDNARKEPYSQVLFFTKFDPATYQQTNFEIPLSEYYTNLHRNIDKNIGRVTVRAINWKSDLVVDQYLVGDALAISYEQIARHHLILIAEIFYPDGEPAFRIVKTQPKLKEDTIK